MSLSHVDTDGNMSISQKNRIDTDECYNYLDKYSTPDQRV